MYLQQTPLDCEYHQNEMRTTCANPEEFPYYYFENLRNLNFPKGGGGSRPHSLPDQHKKNLSEWTDNNSS